MRIGTVQLIGVQRDCGAGGSGFAGVGGLVGRSGKRLHWAMWLVGSIGSDLAVFLRGPFGGLGSRAEDRAGGGLGLEVGCAIESSLELICQSFLANYALCTFHFLFLPSHYSPLYLLPPQQPLLEEAPASPMRIFCEA